MISRGRICGRSVPELHADVLAGLDIPIVLRCFVAVEETLERVKYQTAAMQSTSTSKCPGHAGTQMKIRAGGFSGK